MSDNKTTTVIPWREFSKGERPDYAQDVILLTVNQEIVMGCRSFTDKKGEHYTHNGDNFSGRNIIRSEKDFIAWVPLKLVSDSGPEIPESFKKKITPADDTF